MSTDDRRQPSTVDLGLQRRCGRCREVASPAFEHWATQRTERLPFMRGTVQRAEAGLVAEVAGNGDGKSVGTSVVNDPDHMRMTSRLTWRKPGALA